MKNKVYNELIILLKEILKNEKIELISEFQNKVWDIKITEKDEVLEILSELAYDLDYFEPDQELLKEDPSFFNYDILKKEIKEALGKIERILKKKKD